MAGKSGLFIRQFVIGLGFLSGICTAIGFDPQAAVLGLLGTAVGSVYPDPNVRLLLILLPTILLLLSVYAAYRKGMVLGLVSVVIAYFAGLTVIGSPAAGLLLFCIAVVSGFVATNRKFRRRIAGK